MVDRVKNENLTTFGICCFTWRNEHFAWKCCTFHVWFQTPNTFRHLVEIGQLSDNSADSALLQYILHNIRLKSDFVRVLDHPMSWFLDHPLSWFLLQQFKFSTCVVAPLYPLRYHKAGIGYLFSIWVGVMVLLGRYTVFLSGYPNLWWISSFFFAVVLPLTCMERVYHALRRKLVWKSKNCISTVKNYYP